MSIAAAGRTATCNHCGKKFRIPHVTLGGVQRVGSLFWTEGPAFFTRLLSKASGRKGITNAAPDAEQPFAIDHVEGRRSGTDLPT